MAEAPDPDRALIDLSVLAADAVDAQVERLKAAANVQEGSRAQIGVTKEAAILHALVARRETEDRNLAVRAVLDRLEMLATKLTRVSETVERSVQAFSEATDASTQNLTTWTKVMAWATITLAVFTIAQFVLALLTALRGR